MQRGLEEWRCGIELLQIVEDPTPSVSCQKMIQDDSHFFFLKKNGHAVVGE